MGWIEGASQDEIDYLFKEYRPFVVEGKQPKYRIRIIAANIHLQDEPPTGFD
jgi:hypothetical protein